MPSPSLSNPDALKPSTLRPRIAACHPASAPAASINPSGRAAHAMRRRAVSAACGVAWLPLLLLTACGGGQDGSATGASTTPAAAEPTMQAQSAGGSNTAASSDNLADLATVAAPTQAMADGGLTLQAVADRAAAVAAALGGQGGLGGGGKLPDPPPLPSPQMTTTLDCNLGGTMTLVLSSPTWSQLFNAKPDAGEHYQVTFQQCVGRPKLPDNTPSAVTVPPIPDNLLGTTTLDGSFTVDVVAVDDSTGAVTRQYTFSAPGLKTTWQQAAGARVPLPPVQVLLTGVAQQVQRSTSNADGSTTQASTWTSDALSWAATANAHTVTLTATALTLDIANTQTGTAANSSWLATHLKAASTLGIQRNGGTGGGSTTLALDLTVSGDGQPQTGSLSLVTERNRWLLDVQAGAFTVQFDRGNDGVIDRAHTFTPRDYANAL